MGLMTLLEAFEELAVTFTQASLETLKPIQVGDLGSDFFLQ